MELNQRCIDMLSQLANVSDPLPIATLKDRYKVSERTVRYDLKQISEFLQLNALGTLDKVYKKGYVLNCDDEQRQTLKGHHLPDINEVHYYTSEERQKIMLLELLNADDPIKTFVLQDKLSVSRGTVIKELQAVDDWLSNYDLTLIKKPNYGLKIQGTETCKRNALLGLAKDFMTTEQILSMISSQNDQHENRLLFNIDLKVLEETMPTLEEIAGIKFGDNAYASLFTHLAIALQRIREGKSIYLPPEDLAMLEKTEEFNISSDFAQVLEDKFSIRIPDTEIGYITLHIMASQLKPGTMRSPDILEEATEDLNATDLLLANTDYDLMEMASDITNYIKAQLNVAFADDERVLLDLCIHLKPAIHRCKYGMYLTNPLLEDIKKNYYRLFRVVREAMLLLKIKYPIEMNDHELSYIALHFAAEIEKGNMNFNQKLNVLLICASGIGTAKMLNNRIRTNFSDLNVIDTISYLDFYKKQDWQVDLIVSTIELKETDYPCIVVNPLLQKEDVQKIEGYIFKHHNIVRSPALIESTKEPLQGVQLSDLLTADTIQLDVDADSWQDALYAGGDVLKKLGCIQDAYIDHVIENLLELGPYIVIAPGIAFSHGSYNIGVDAMGMSLIRLRNAVKFNHSTNDPVKLIFTLAATDKTSHYSALTSLMDILLNQQQLNTLFNATDVDDLVNVFRNNK